MPPEPGRTGSTSRLEPSLRWRWAACGPWERLALTVWSIVLCVICLRVVIAPQEHNVLAIYRVAAQRWLAGADVYDPIEGLDMFRYSPLVAVLMVPFHLLPLPLGGVVWRLLNAGIYLGALLWGCRAAFPRLLTREQRAVLFLLIVPLSIGSLHNGQSNALVLGLLIAACVAVRTQRWNLASLCLAVAIGFKIYPVAIGLLLTVLYWRPLLPRLALALVLGMALPYAFGGPAYVTDMYVSWISHFQEYDRQRFPVKLWYRDLRLFCRVWLVPLTPQVYLAIQLLGAAGIAGLCVAAHRRGWPQRTLLPLLLSLGCCWMTVLGPATEGCTYMLLAPPLAWALLQAWLEPTTWSRRAGLLLIAGLLLFDQVSIWFPWGRAIRDLAMQPLAGSLFLAYLVVLALRELGRSGSLKEEPRETSPWMRAA